MGLMENLDDYSYILGYLRTELCGNSTVNCSELLEVLSYGDYAYTGDELYTQRLTVPIFFFLTFVIGVIGNLMVIFVVVRNVTMKTVTNLYLTNLAISDLLFLSFCAPFTAIPYFLQSWPFGEVMCRIVNYMMMVTTAASVLTLMTVGIDRYYAVVYPVSSRARRTFRNARIGVTVIWLLASISMIPVAIISRIQHFYQFGASQAFCHEFFPSDIDRRVYNLLKFIFLYLFPLIVIAGCYVKMAKHLCVSVVPVGDGAHLNETTAKAFRSRRKVAKMVFVVVVVFGLCWLPIHIVYLRNEFGPHEYSESFYVLKIIAHAICYLNSAVNPVIYSFMSESFRRCFKMTLTFRGRRRDNRMFMVVTPANHPQNNVRSAGSSDTRKATRKSPLGTSEQGAGAIRVSNAWVAGSSLNRNLVAPMHDGGEKIHAV